MTSVDPRPTPTIAWAKPSAWNIGAHSSVTSRARNGTLLSRLPRMPSERGSSRGAPLGVPVVPLLTTLIDHRRAVAVAEGADGDSATEHAVALESQEQLGDAVRRLDADQATAYAQQGKVGLVTYPLGDLQAAADDRLWIKLHLASP